MTFCRLLTLSVSIAALSLAGCGGGGGAGTTLPPDPLNMFVNASPDSSPLDFFYDDTQVANNLTYLAVPAGFQTFDPGDFDCTVYKDGDPEAIWSEAIGQNRDESYIVVTVGIQDFQNETLKRLRIAVLKTDRTSPNNSARLVIFHAYNRKVGFQNHNIDFQNPGNNPQYKQLGLTFGNRVELTIDPGTYTFVARRTGTESEVTPQLTTTFESGKIYLAVVSGIEGAAGLQSPRITYFNIPVKS